jgi:hypothetical protein
MEKTLTENEVKLFRAVKPERTVKVIRRILE